MSLQKALVGILASNKRVNPEPDWANISGANPTQSTTDETLDGFSGSIDVSIVYTGAASVEYRINSGTWTTYSSAFSVDAGQTVGWRFTNFGSDSGTATVTNDTASQQLDTFTVTLT